MSAHEAHIPSRDEVIQIITRPIPKRLGTLSLVLAVVGLRDLSDRRRSPATRGRGRRTTSTGCSSRRSRRPASRSPPRSA